jgi:hypothetical protein
MAQKGCIASVDDTIISINFIIYFFNVKMYINKRGGERLLKVKTASRTSYTSRVCVCVCVCVWPVLAFTHFSSPFTFRILLNIACKVLTCL